MSDSGSDLSPIRSKTNSKPKASKSKPVIMTWGKYKGKSVLDIIGFDVSYAKWMHRQEFVKDHKDIYAILDKELVFAEHC